MFAKEETHDLYSAIDLAVDKLEHQAQKLKAKRQRATRAAARGARAARSAHDAGARGDRGAGAPRGHPTRARVRRSRCRVDEAVEQLDALARRVPRLHQRVDQSARGPLPAQGRRLRADRAGGTLSDGMKIDDILARGAGRRRRSTARTQDRRASTSWRASVARHHPEIDRGRLVQALEDRERLNSTALGDGVAIPHGKLAGREARRRGVRRGARRASTSSSLDGKPTHLFFLLVAPEDSAGAHLKALARISRLLKDEAFRARLHAGAATRATLYETIRDEDARY